MKAAVNVNHVKSLKSQMKEKIANTPAKLNAPFSKTNLSHVNLSLKEQHTKCVQLEKKISKMQEQINLIGVEVTPVFMVVCYIFSCLFLSLNESSCQTRKNVFYFTSKAVCSYENQILEF